MTDLIQIIMSVFVEAGGQGIGRGGKGILLSGLRKIGWAKGGGDGSGSRLGGHKLGGHRMGSGYGGHRKGGAYNPKTDLKERMSADANRGRRSGSDAVRAKAANAKPGNLFGRSSFQGADTLSGTSGSRWVRNTRNSKGSASQRPRGFIKF